MLCMIWVLCMLRMLCYIQASMLQMKHAFPFLDRATDCCKFRKLVSMCFSQAGSSEGSTSCGARSQDRNKIISVLEEAHCPKSRI